MPVPQKKKAPPVRQTTAKATRKELQGMYEDMLTAVTFFGVAVALHPQAEATLNKQLAHAIVTAKTPEQSRGAQVAAILCKEAVNATRQKLVEKYGVRMPE